MISTLKSNTTINSNLEEMFILQKRLNESTNGKNWELGINKFDKNINWLRCIHMEISELIESTPWKHWKNISSKLDIENIKIELVDIWHFVMSYLLQETNIPKSVFICEKYTKYDSVDTFNIVDIINESEKLSYICLGIQIENIHSNTKIENIIKQYFKLCSICKLDFNTLFKLYIGKNTLNKFRQDHGYKEGTYTKIWNHEEDNIVMMRLLYNLEDINIDTLYTKLKDYYNKL
jgi:dimeric dUTPase (all-alpha-NTP-PPase superfamily)